MKALLITLAVLVPLAALGAWLWTPDKERAALEKKYATGAGDFIEVEGIRLHVRDSGGRASTAVVLIHGLGSSLHTWDAWAAELAKERRVIRFDLPGSGLSAPDPKGDYSDARSMAVLAALLDRLVVPRASLVGNSIGGRLAWRFAAAYPARVDKLVLVAPDGFASPGFEYGKPPEIPAVMGLMRWVLPPAALRMNLAPAYADPKRLTDETLVRYHDLLRAPGVRHAMLQRLRQSVLQEPGPFLARIEAPTLLLWGEADAMIPVANARDYERALRQSSVVILPGVGHVPMEEAPAKSLAPVREFLAT